MPDSKGARPIRTRPGTDSEESHTGRTRSTMATSATSATRTRRASSNGSAAPAEPAEPSTQQDLEATALPGMSLQWLDPRALLLEGNIRSEADLDPEFLDSIR